MFHLHQLIEQIDKQDQKASQRFQQHHHISYSNDATPNNRSTDIVNAQEIVTKRDYGLGCRKNLS